MRLALFDTNILSMAVRDEWTLLLCSWLDNRECRLVISGQQLIELGRAARIVEPAAQMLAELKASCFAGDILDREVNAYPSRLSAAALVRVPFADAAEWLEGMRSQTTAQTRAIQLAYAKRAPARHLQLMDNFPRASSGRFELTQGSEFAFGRGFQALVQHNRAFAEEHADSLAESSLDQFLSLNAVSWVIFHKYYVGKREPHPLSDHGDLVFSQFIPYADLVVTENDLAATLRTVQAHTSHLIPEVLAIRDLKQEMAA